MVTALLNGANFKSAQLYRATGLTRDLGRRKCSEIVEFDHTRQKESGMFAEFLGA